MKLTIGISVALAGCASAAQQSADVYILPAVADSSSTPSVTPSIARLILLERLSPAGQGASVKEIPEDFNLEDVVSTIGRFSPEPLPLFDSQGGAPSQLVVMLEGLTEDQMKRTAEALEAKPAFSISDPPSSGAHDKLVRNDFYNIGITNDHQCSFSEVINPFEERCWSGRSTVAKYHVQKQPEVLSDLARHASRLARLAASGEMETTILLFPITTEQSKTIQWSDKPQELRRRQAEQVISAVDEEKSTESTSPSPASEDQIFYASTVRGSVPACFNSKDSCLSGTGNCSGHGDCLNKYAKPDGSDGKESCYVCHCLSTVNDKGSLSHWAGSTCAKKDVSTPFWLFAGFTLVMVSILYMAIGMLFSVGEEKLPGVIGAGVSRSK